jgi:glycosyltransferase involved in cell wall biosynthesis
MTVTPRFSIAMTTYNGEAFLREQLDSLSAQTTLPCELIIGDDGSTDATEAIINDFSARAPFPVLYERNSKRVGFGENFIQTARRCNGDWIGFCDQDDVWASDKLSWCVKHIAGGPDDLALIAHNAIVVDEHLTRQRPLFQYPDVAYSAPLELNPEWHCHGFTQVFHSRLLRRISSDRRVSFPWNAHQGAHDVWIALVANATGSILRTARPLTLHRRHARASSLDGVVRSGNLVPERFRNHGANYAMRGKYLREVVRALRGCAALAAEPERSQLTSAAVKVEQQAQFLERRGQAYSELKLVTRLKVFGALAADGGYLGRDAWPFGVWRMAKDLAFAIAGPGQALGHSHA